MKTLFSLCVFMTCCGFAWSQSFTVDTILANGNKVRVAIDSGEQMAKE